MTFYKKISDFLYEIPQNYREDMRVPARFYASDKFIDNILKDNCLKQLINVTTLPGIEKYALAMPDIHQGYGFPIGGVAAFDEKTGIISPGGVGYDINCGVRLISTNIDKNEISPYLDDLISALYKNCPSGVGKGSYLKINKNILEDILNNGAEWAIQNGYGYKEDLNYIEENGKMPSADAKYVSSRALERGLEEVGSLGSGNHFLEIGFITEIYDEKIANIAGIYKNQIVIQIHCGSRGLGHQVCSDYVRSFQEYIKKNNIKLIDRELVYAPFHSEEGQKYFKAMSASANYAFANRQVLTHYVRETFKSILKKIKKELIINLIYDITHNIAKLESHNISDNKKKNFVVHRKGATRAFGPNNKFIPEKFKNLGQPVLVPGSMGTCSYLLFGTEKAMTETFGSCCHGAGRVLSRNKAKNEIDGAELKAELENKGIKIKTGSLKGLAEEAPDVYKDVNEVINIIANENIAIKCAKIKPIAVIKG